MVVEDADCIDTAPVTPEIPRSCRIIIIEGIPGAGKTTLSRSLERGIGDRRVMAFGETSLLHGWKHTYLPGIHELRLQLYERLLDAIEARSPAEDDLLFVLTRMHLSFVLLGGDATAPAYGRVLARLQQCNAHVLVPIVPESDIESRASHHERDDWLWRAHLQRRMSDIGCSDLQALYGGYQQSLLQLLRSQPLGYTLLPPLP